MKPIQFSNGDVWQNPIIRIEEDLHNERAGFFRAYYADNLETSVMCTVIGYCSPGGSHRTIKACVAEMKRLGKTEPIYRNGRRIG